MLYVNTILYEIIDSLHSPYLLTIFFSDVIFEWSCVLENTGMEILISKKIILALILLATMSFYITFVFNSCVVTSLSKTIPKVRLISQFSSSILNKNITSVKLCCSSNCKIIC